jgi:hypothetical protein
MENNSTSAKKNEEEKIKLRLRFKMAIVELVSTLRVA